MPEQKDLRTLEEALRETAQVKWQGRRCYATNMSQVAKAIGALAFHARPAGNPMCAGSVRIAEVTDSVLRKATAAWYAQGLSPATINKRLNCLSAMGVSVEGCRVREPKVLKWWLKPEDERALVAILRNHGDLSASRAACMIQWTTRTGLRIEESLRLTWKDVSLHRGEVTVPGLKTSSAQATLPLGHEALEVLARVGHQTFGDPLVFQLSYGHMLAWWDECRVQLGIQDNPTATLKALRRSAARHLHITKGMPLDMVRQYLRHEDMETTLGYLRLTGGYGTEEMRKWL